MFQESFPLTDKTCFLYGNPQPSHLLIQPVGGQDLSGGLGKRGCLPEKNGRRRFSSRGLRDQKLAIRSFLPGKPPPVWGTEAFGNGAAGTLDFILRDLLPELKTPLLSFLRASGNSGRLFPGGTFFPPGPLCQSRRFLRHCRCLSLCSGFRAGWSMPFPIL